MRPMSPAHSAHEPGAISMVCEAHPDRDWPAGDPDCAGPGMPCPACLFPRAFVLQRDEDVSGVSGTGIVAGGVAFPDGTVALRWYSDWPTSVVFHDRGVEAVERIHGHDGRTRIVWADAEVWPPNLKGVPDGTE